MKDELKRGDTIKCHDDEDMYEHLQALRDEGYHAFIMNYEQHIIIIVGRTT